MHSLTLSLGLSLSIYRRESMPVLKQRVVYKVLGYRAGFLFYRLRGLISTFKMMSYLF